MSELTRDTLFIFNPYANEGSAGKLWEKCLKKYPELPPKPIDITTCDLKQLIAQKKPAFLVIAGGDGTINSVCQKIQSIAHKPILGVLPFGFGNALAYCLGVDTIEKSIEVLRLRKDTITIDAMKTNVPEAPLGLFNIGIGFDARIVHNRMNDRYIGFRSYIISAIKSLLFHPKKEITILIDHSVKVHALTSSLVIAKCPIIGRNFLISPEAKLNDGLLDCTIFSTHYTYITNLRLKGFKHPLYSKEQKIYFKAKHIQIEGEPFIQIDGDPYIHKGDVMIEIMPKQFTFLTNTKTNLDDFDLT